MIPATVNVTFLPGSATQANISWPLSDNPYLSRYILTVATTPYEGTATPTDPDPVKYDASTTHTLVSFQPFSNISVIVDARVEVLQNNPQRIRYVYPHSFLTPEGSECNNRGHILVVATS